MNHVWKWMRKYNLLCFEIADQLSDHHIRIKTQPIIFIIQIFVLCGNSASINPSIHTTHRILADF